MYIYISPNVKIQTFGNFRLSNLTTLYIIIIPIQVHTNAVLCVIAMLLHPFQL